MAQQCSLPSSKSRGHPSPFPADPSGAEDEHAAKDLMQLPASDASARVHRNGADVQGRIEGSGSGRDLAIAVDDRIAAVTRTSRVGGATRFSAVLPDWAAGPGANDVAVLEVGGGGALARVRVAP